MQALAPLHRRGVAAAPIVTALPPDPVTVTSSTPPDASGTAAPSTSIRVASGSRESSSTPTSTPPSGRAYGRGPGPQLDSAGPERGDDQPVRQRVVEAPAHGCGPIALGAGEHQPMPEPARIGLLATEVAELLAPVVRACRVARPVIVEHRRHLRR